MEVTVALKNPPSGGTMWSISLIDWDVTAIIDFVGHNGKERLGIDEVAVFEIPSGWTFPLRIILSVKRWKDGIVGGTIQQLYYVQSFRPYLWDFDEMEWSDIPDPTYREVFIPDYGNYSYNVATEQFEAEEEPPPGVGLALKAYGYGNLVVYTGKAQTAEAAFASIKPYLDRNEDVLYWNNDDRWWQTVAQFIPNELYFGTMVPYGVYWIAVTQDCTWTYGADETPPSSVQLYTGWNYVCYCGPAQSVEDALASILPYVVIYYSYDTYQGWQTPITMVPNMAYAIKVTQDCVWTFEVPAVVPCEITITAPSSAQEGETVSVSALIRNISSISIMYKIEISAAPDLFPAFRIGTIEKNISGGATFTAYGSFTMPASNTTILIWVERWAADHWVYDSSASKVVSLEVVPEYRGSIARKELDYDGTRNIIPVY